MTARLATPSDAAALAALHAEVFAASPWDTAFWRKATASAFDRAFIVGDPPEGFALLRLVGPEAEILTIGTVREGCGHGAALLGAMAAAAVASGAERLFLEVSAANKRARRLYERARFIAAGTRPNYYPDGSDAVIMRLDLIA